MTIIARACDAIWDSGSTIGDRCVVNAHPPTSILLALPFAKLDMAMPSDLEPGFVAAWRPASGSCNNSSGFPSSAWSIAPLLALLLLCFPLWENAGWGSSHSCSYC